ncbi:tetratricopeptide repeat protein, partial [Polynucleobacter sp. UK-Kesae-W10]|uniref:tetratricopeptide repeat protein n=1 Tax=Polynucleobacter sp. UK-Kesae-W10 TaxID=1819738 RepID=UPI001C0D5A3B
MALPIPTGANAEELNAYYYRRAKAYEVLGDDPKVLENIKKVVKEYPSTNADLHNDELRFYANLEMSLGNTTKALEALNTAKLIGYFGWRISAYYDLGEDCLLVGDIPCANEALQGLKTTRGMSARYIPSQNRNINNISSFNSREYFLEGQILLKEGGYKEAEVLLRDASNNLSMVLEGLKNRDMNSIDYEKRIPEDNSFESVNAYLLLIKMQIAWSNALLNQGKFIEAELKAREAVLLAIQRVGPNSRYTATALLALARVISEEGRQPESVLLANNALKIIQASGAANSSIKVAEVRGFLAKSLVADGKYTQAEKVFTEMVDGIKSDPEIAARYSAQDLDWALAMVKTGKASQAAAMTSQMLAKDEIKFDKNSPRLAMIRAFNAAALQASGQSSQALGEFKQSVPVLVDQARNDSENATATIRQTQRMTFILEEYLASLAQQAKADPSGAAAAQAFQIADLARGSGVQRALTSSAARANISDPQLASLARREQDLQQRINTLSELLTGLLSAPPDQQLPA